MAEIRKREDQKREDTWDLEAIYPDGEAWKREADRLEEMLGVFASHQGHMGDSSSRMYEILEEYCGIQNLAEKLYVYASMKLDENTADSAAQQREGRARLLITKLSDACAWMEPEILALDEERLERFMGEHEGLARYRVYLEEILRRKAHTLSEDKEQILARAAQISQGPGQIYTMFQNADLTFESVSGPDGERLPLTQESFVALEQSRDRDIRRQAFQKLYGAYEAFGNTLAAMFDAKVRGSLFFARERGYGSTLEMALDDGPIPTEVYDQLIRTVHQNLPAMHRYVELRKQCLGVEELHMYDVYAPMTELSRAGAPEKTYTFEEAKQMVLDGLAPLGEDYRNILREGFDHRWIDVYENEGKRGGAYSGGCYGTHPYVLMNFQGNLNSVFTLAHEMGHSVHSYYTRKNQPYIYGDYKIFVAEVASTCNEALLIGSLLDKTDDAARRMELVQYLLEQFKSTLFRQTMFAEFERMAHQYVAQGGTLTADTLCGMYRKLNEEYFGPHMVSDPGIAWEWARIPHFYRPFYVYQYATGFSVAMAIAKKIREGEDQAVEHYLKFLSSGSSMSPLELLRLCGVDMATPRPVQDALEVFEKYLEEMERLRGQSGD